LVLYFLGLNKFYKFKKISWNQKSIETIDFLKNVKIDEVKVKFPINNKID
jgi:hypothetical protein